MVPSACDPRERAHRLAGVLDDLAAEAVAARDGDTRFTARPQRLEPIDPEDLPTTALHALGGQDWEIRWTRWLFGMLDDEPLRQSVGSPLLRAIHGAAEGVCLVHEAWPASIEDIVEVWTEMPIQNDKRIDLVVATTTSIIVIEKKLMADWHDAEDVPQATAYREAGEKLRVERGLPHLQTVLLTMRPAMVVPESWIRVTYQAVAGLVRAFLAATPPKSVREYARVAPLYEFVRAVDLYLREKIGDESPWDRYHRLGLEHRARGGRQ